MDPTRKLARLDFKGVEATLLGKDLLVQAGEVNPAGDFQRDAAVERRGSGDPHRLAAGSGVEIVDQDARAAGLPAFWRVRRLQHAAYSSR